MFTTAAGALHPFPAFGSVGSKDILVMVCVQPNTGINNMAKAISAPASRPNWFEAIPLQSIPSAAEGGLEKENHAFGLAPFETVLPLVQFSGL
jgi:hypothetical protein